MKRAKSLLIGLLLLGSASWASAADYYVDITNHTGYAILYMYISPADAASWEEDVLGSNVLRDSNTQRVTLTNYKSPIFAWWMRTRTATPSGMWMSRSGISW